MASPPPQKTQRSAHPLVEAATHAEEPEAARKLEAWFVAEDAFVEYFEHIDEERRRPDIHGKNLSVGAGQRADIFRMIEGAAKVLEMEAPECFIREGYTYRAQSRGLGRPRIELSARLVEDHKEAELTHCIAKEMFHIKAGHLRYEVMNEMMLNVINKIPSLPGINIIRQFGGTSAIEAVTFTLRNQAFNWAKYACFSAEAFATAYTANVEASVDATLLSVLGERTLVKQVQLEPYIAQIGEIESALGPMATLGKINENRPYGPYRVLNLLRFIASSKGRSLAQRLREARA